MRYTASQSPAANAPAAQLLQGNGAAMGWHGSDIANEVSGEVAGSGDEGRNTG